MNLITVSEHTFDLDLLTNDKSRTILDLGCRGFGLEKYFFDKRVFVYNVDCDLSFPGGRNNFAQVAITNYTGKCGVVRNNDPQATRIGPGNEIPCYTLESFSLLVLFGAGAYDGNAFWDAIKIDIEGSEYDVIMSLTKAPAKQLSIEFHLHTGTTESKMKDMEEKLLLLGYEIVQHEKTEMHGAGFNYWNSLFLLK